MTYGAVSAEAPECADLAVRLTLTSREEKRCFILAAEEERRLVTKGGQNQAARARLGVGDQETPLSVGIWPA